MRKQTPRRKEAEEYIDQASNLRKLALEKAELDKERKSLGAYYSKKLRKGYMRFL